MKVKKLALRNFRNIKEAIFYPNPKINFLVGANGQGKTSFIEAIGFLSSLRSFRDSKTFQVMNWGSEKSEISCSLTESDPELGSWNTELKVVFEKQPKQEATQKATKLASINDKIFRSSTQYLSQRFKNYGLGMHTIVFNPSDHDLVRGAPTQRRSYLDGALAAEDWAYLKSLQRYQKVLTQRNALLKQRDRISQMKSAVWQGFTEPLIEHGAYLTWKRLEWIARIQKPLNMTLKNIAPQQPTLKMSYLSSWVPPDQNLSFDINELSDVHFTGQGDVPLLKLLEQSFRVKLKLYEEAERKACHTLVGPHRDDWAFFFGRTTPKRTWISR
jgi:DNA replication and repair protein RecF